MNLASPNPLRRGSCPGVYTPMESGDGLLLRVRGSARAFDAADLRALAELARRHANGLLEITRRGNVQLRGVRELAVLQAGLVARGLALADPLRERRLAPLIVDASAGPALAPLAHGVAAELLACTGAETSSAKFAVVLQADADDAVAADIRVRVQAERGLAHVALGGSGPLGWCALERVPRLLGALVALVVHGGPGLRMRDLGLRPAELAALRARFGLEAPQAVPPPRRLALGAQRAFFAAALPFGASDVAGFERIAALCERHRAVLRFTPGRALLLFGVPASAYDQVYAAGLSIDEADPLREASACPGSPACDRALGDTRALARALAPALRGRSLHVSGCEKGCAHSGAAAITLVCAVGGARLALEGDVQAAAQAPVLTPEEVGRLLAAPVPEVRVRPPMTRKYDYVRDGAEIYRRSFAIIRHEARLARFSPVEERVAVRLIHTSGMVDLADDLVFTPGFAEAAQGALRGGAPVLCDAKMIVSGVTRARLSAANELLCFLDQPGLPALARELGNTRSAAALEFWRPRLAGALVAIGNAPTALFRLLELLDELDARPAAVIGLPVGFVGAAESKDALLADGRVPAMIVRGRRGGSAMTVAAINALASHEE